MFAIKTSRGRATTIAAATALIAAGIVGVTGSAAEAAAGTYTASPTSGPWGSTTVVQLTGKDFKSASGTLKVGVSVNTNVQLATSCGTSPTTSVGKVATGIAASSVSVQSSTKMLVSVVPGGAATDAKTAYKICIYDAAGTGLYGSATWTAYPVPTITNINGTAVASDALLPTYGGTTVALDGTNFTSKATVTVGGVAATNVKYIDTTSLTFTAPAGTGANAAVLVTTEGGTSAATGTEIDYTPAAKVSPTRGTAVTDIITVTGKGFVSLLSGANAGIAFVQAGDTYDGTIAAGTGTAEVAKASVTIVSDTEIAFALPAAAVAVPGAYTIMVCDDITAAPGATSTGISEGSTFTVVGPLASF